MIKQLLNDYGTTADEELLRNITSHIKEIGEANGKISDGELTQIIDKLREDRKDG